MKAVFGEVRRRNHVIRHAVLKESISYCGGIAFDVGMALVSLI